MRSGKVQSFSHITVDDIRAIKTYKKLTDQEAARLLKQIKEFSNLIYHFVTKQEDE